MAAAASPRYRVVERLTGMSKASPRGRRRRQGAESPAEPVETPSNAAPAAEGLARAAQCDAEPDAAPAARAAPAAPAVAAAPTTAVASAEGAAAPSRSRSGKAKSRATAARRSAVAAEAMPNGTSGSSGPAETGAAPSAAPPRGDRPAAVDLTKDMPLQRFMDRLGATGISIPELTDEPTPDAPPTSPPTPHRHSPPYPMQVATGPDALAVVALRPRVGEILTRARRMPAASVELVLKRQGQAAGRFGEIALAMGLVDASDLLWALSQQSGRGHERISPLAGASPELVVARDPQGAAAQGIRELRSQLLDGVLHPESPQRRALAVVSTGVGDGRTYLAANLALSLAQQRGRTILVEADLRAPRIQRLFAVPDPVLGLGAVLDGSGLLRDAIVSLPDIPSLHLLVAGVCSGNPLGLLMQPAAAVLMQTLLREYEHVIVDTPAVQAGADARSITQYCGAAMIVARKGRSRMDDVYALVLQLQRSEVALAGVVMNRH
jgi:receptor protein-tyrosine kinase